jgi:hypothetical protein
VESQRAHRDIKRHGNLFRHNFLCHGRAKVNDRDKEGSPKLQLHPHDGGGTIDDTLWPSCRSDAVNGRLSSYLELARGSLKCRQDHLAKGGGGRCTITGRVKPTLDVVTALLLHRGNCEGPGTRLGGGSTVGEGDT